MAVESTEPLIVTVSCTEEEDFITKYSEEDLKAYNQGGHGCHLLQDGLFRLRELAENPDLSTKLDALFEESHQRKEDIKNLPMEDACWYIGEFEQLLYPNSHMLRLMAVIDISSPNPVKLSMSIASGSDLTFHDQAMRLFCHACFHPMRKQRRRPHHVKLRNTAGAKNVVLEMSDFGVNFFDSAVTLNRMWKAISQDDTVWFRSCFCCGIKGTSDMFRPCPQCKAVVYCDEGCRIASWRDRHQKWCKKFVKYMEKENELAKFPFSFAEVTTNKDFNQVKLKCFLQENDVYGKGLWRREYPVLDGSSTRVAFGELLSLSKPYALPLEDAVLECSPSGKEPPCLEKPLQDWADYYTYRGFWLDSPIAGLLHYSMTLYWIVTQCLPKHYPVVFEKMKLSKDLHVHIIGAEKEAEMFHPFLECARLLAPVTLHLHLFGDELSKRIHNQSSSRENLTFHLHQGLYHESKLSDFPQPDVVIGFNAGLSAYKAFVDTIKRLLENRTPLYCTDYCYYSIVHSKKALTNSQIGTMLNPVINPFRSPIRIVAPDMNFPRYSNAFVYYLKPHKTSEENIKESKAGVKITPSYVGTSLSHSCDSATTLTHAEEDSPAITSDAATDRFHLTPMDKKSNS